MKEYRHIKWGVTGVFFALALLVHPPAALAATLSLTSASSHVTAGDIVTVRVSVNAGGQAINTAEGTVQFPTEVLQALSLDKSSSIFSIWVQDPSFSNQSGTVSFSGGLPTPGYQGSNGTVLTVSFRAKRVGVATLSLADATVRANDGLGTDVLQTTGTLQLTVISAPVAPAPQPQPAEPAKNPPASSATATTTVFTVPPTPMPVLDLIQSHMNRGDQLTISGQAPPQDAGVYLYVAKDGGTPIELTAKPSASGAFSSLGPILENGLYEVWAVGVSPGGVLSEPTDTMRISVGEESLLTLGSVSLTLTSILLLLLLLTFVTLVAAVVGWYKVYQYHKGRRREVLRMQRSMHRAFTVFKDGIEKHVEALDNAGTKRELTVAESKLKADMTSNLLKLERYIEDELT